jgi:U1 small nuclear ribonucleoprotein 70kDa
MAEYGDVVLFVSAAYKHADGKKIDGRRILVDVERGRTVKGWRPRRLGGGLGNTRKGGADVNTKYSGRDDFVGRDRAVPDDRKSLEVHSMRDERPPRGGGGGSPDRFRRSTRSRERSRERRRPRSRSRERRRRSSRERRRSPEREIKKEPVDESEAPAAEAGETEDKKTFRDDGARKRRRSRSPRDRRRSRSPRDRKRGRRSRSRERRGSKPRDRNRGEKDTGGEGGGTDANGGSGVFIKQEIDDEGAYDGAAGDQFQNYDNASSAGGGGGGTEYPNYEDA